MMRRYLPSEVEVFELLQKYLKISIFALLTLAFFFMEVSVSLAHNPHDVIDALTLSPNYHQDKTLFISIQAGGLFKSVDGGYSWKKLVNGLDNKYVLTSIAIAPSYRDDQTLFVSSDGDGIYRSQDGGVSWVKVNQGLDSLHISLLAISKAYEIDQVVLAGSQQGGLYRTEDGGASWQQVINQNVTVTAVAFLGEGEQVLLGDRQGILYWSKDGGKSWQQQMEFKESGGITATAISPANAPAETIFVGTGGDGIYKSEDGGTSFGAASQGLSDRSIRSLAISPEYEIDNTIFATSWNEAVYQSMDGGRNWQMYSQGVTKDKQADSEQYKSPHFRDVRLSPAFGRDKTLFLAGYNGLFRSTDGGYVWGQLETLPARLIMRIGVSPGDKDEYTLALTTYGGGIYTSEDQGLTWAVNNKGLVRIDVVDIGFSPTYPSDHTLLITSDRYFLRSTDSGRNWDRIELRYENSRTRLSSILENLGLPDRLSKWVLTEADKGAILPDVLTVSPNFPLDQTVYFGTRYRGIYKSLDAGSSWVPVWPDQWISSLIISPNYVSDQTLFAGVRGAGIYKTEDGGGTWQAVNYGLAFIFANAELPGAPQGNIKLAISPDYKNDQTVFAGATEGLFKTVDGGQNWRQLAVLTRGEGSVEDMAVSPKYKDDQTMLVSLKGRGLFRSTDGGLSFVEIGPDLINRNYNLKQIVFSPTYPTDATIFGISDEEIFYSTDGGDHWEALIRPVRYENVREAIHYEGEWQVVKGDDFSAANVSQSRVVGSKASVNFVGNGITWIGTTSPQQGIAKVYLDGQFQGEVDQFSDSHRVMVNSYSISGLTAGPHTFTIEVTGAKSALSTDYGIEVDAFDITP